MGERAQEEHSQQSPGRTINMQLHMVQKSIAQIIDSTCDMQAATQEGAITSHPFANDVESILNDTAEGRLARSKTLQARVKVFVQLLQDQRRDHEVRQNHIDHLIRRILEEPQNDQLVVELDRTEALSTASKRRMDKIVDDLLTLRKDLETRKFFKYVLNQEK